MSANPMELLPAYLGSAESGLKIPFRHERRRRLRTRVHWPVVIFRNGGDGATESITEDLSSGGFYCLSREPFAPDETLLCTLQVPVHHPAGREGIRFLECRVRVMRTEPVSEGLLGIACRIEDYRFLLESPE